MLNKLNYLETSALTGQNVAQAFQSLIAGTINAIQRFTKNREGQVGGMKEEYPMAQDSPK